MRSLFRRISFGHSSRATALAAFLSAGLMLAIPAQAANTSIESFSKAKKLLENKVYFDHRVTLYCRMPFDAKKNITLTEGFKADKHAKRAARVEWEHVVPAENFGRSFSEWRDGHEACVDSKGRSFKGRSCAEKVNREYRLMQSDLYNLYPASGAVNALRSNFNFGMLPGVGNTFGTCAMKVADRRAEPPEYARGTIARTVLYMAGEYPRYRLSDQQRRLMEAWNKMHPVDEWECLRAERIRRIQGAPNPVVEEACRAAGFRK